MTYADEYANQSAKLLERGPACNPDDLPALMLRQLEVLSGIGFGILAVREEIAGQVADLNDALADVADKAGTVSDRISDVDAAVNAAVEDMLRPLEDIASAAGAGWARRWLRWLPGRRPVIITPGPWALEEHVPGGSQARRAVTLSPGEADTVWHALADAASYRAQRLNGEGEMACGDCAQAALLAGEQHGPDAAAAACCPAHEQDERHFSAYSMLRLRLSGGELR
jgi:hypothetical protein